MAKTKLLAQIDTQTSALQQQMTELATSLSTATALTAQHWTALSDIKTKLDNLKVTVGKLQERMKSWDGSTKLRDIFKNKQKLATARDDARNRAVAIKQQVETASQKIDLLVKEMQKVSRAAAH